MRLDDLNALAPAAAEAELRRCCGSTAWAQRMAAARPFATIADVEKTADTIWRSLDKVDWLEAFAAHPRIGETTTGAWSGQEQSRARGAAADVRARLLSGNRSYEARFGYIFIVCATGRTAEEMLAELERRLRNDPDAELRAAAEEQRRVMQLRIAKLLDRS